MARPGTTMKLTAPLKVLLQRMAFTGLIGASVGLLVLGKAEAPVVERARMTVVDGVAPILDAIGKPIDTAARMIDTARHYADVHEENRRLREENLRLLHWQQVARNLEAENRAMRDMQRVATEPGLTFVTARVIADAGGAFVRSVLIAAGTRDGIAKGQPALVPDGLVGRVGETGERAARVLLLTDLNSHVPVQIEGTRDRAIIDGDNSDMPKLTFLSSGARPQLGDRIVTSGDGGVFPPGLPVGIVVQTGEHGVRVRPFADFHRLEAIRIVDYGLAGTLPVAAPPPQPRRGR
ncbi:MAG: rod shape-determining protein MreC [Alphaproteobacteria bacterium]|nr:rod shape-determining protein MreC [Alphaproteobacteria bacterium]